MSLCPCQSGKDYDACCGAIIGGTQTAPTAEALMRSRYSAFVKGAVDYLKDSLHPDHRTDFDPMATKDLADNSTWQGRSGWHRRVHRHLPHERHHLRTP